MDFAAVAGVLIDAPSAWLSEPAIAAMLGAPNAELATAVAGLVAGRLLERWDRPDGAVLTLTALGAKQLGVRLVETADAEVYHWSRDAASVRTRRIGRRSIERTEAHDAALRQLPDRRPPLPADDGPKPRVLLWGNGLVPWDELNRRRPRPEVRCRECLPRKRRRKRASAIVIAHCVICGFGVRPRLRLEHCPACHDRRLPASWYCLRCDRWGKDGYFARRLGPKRRKAG